MANVNTLIGPSLDYSTITLWNAANGGGDGLGNDNCKGECHDFTFDEIVSVGFTAASTTLSVAPGHRHDGTGGTGARIAPSSGFNQDILTFGYITFRNPTVCEWLEIDAGYRDLRGLHQTDCGEGWFRYLLVCRTADNDHGYAVQSGAHGNPMHFMNSIIYDAKATFNASTIHARGFNAIAPQNGALHLYNLTVHDVHKESALGNAYCIDTVDDSDVIIKNCVCTDPGGTSSGTKLCYTLSPPSNATYQYNLSSDPSASGTGSLISKPSVGIYVSKVRGSEDLHQKAGSPAIDAGVDLGTTPTGVDQDIDGNTRSGIWDMGCHEFLTSGYVPYAAVLANIYGIVLQ